MSIRNVVLNVADVTRAVDFYTRFLTAKTVGQPTPNRALLDLVTATLELRQLSSDATPSAWIPDDLQKGFRHIGFKVDAVDPRAAELKAAGVRFHLDPLNAEGAVRICFFFDPDGTLLEFVEGDLQYASVVDPDGVARERALGVPDRPRFDHVALTVADRAATEAFYRSRFEFRFLGTIEQPHDPRGFSIGYLKSGDTVLEIFTYEAAKQDEAPQLDAPGFAYVELSGENLPELHRRLSASDGTPVYVDADGFPFSIRSATTSDPA
jgi:catechol 2,3-dioxygenase-like lactoylglutathione lyase family enzyme